MKLPTITHYIVECQHCGGAGRLSVVCHESIRKRRKAAGISLREMARRTGFTAPYISDVERGRRTCTGKIEKAYKAL